jgi:hypothetical protein
LTNFIICGQLKTLLTTSKKQDVLNLLYALGTPSSPLKLLVSAKSLHFCKKKKQMITIRKIASNNYAAECTKK